MLSGFVLAYNYHDTFATLDCARYGRFLWQRLARIYPAHCLGLATWGLLGSANVALKHKAMLPLYGAKALLAQLFLVHGWSIPLVMSWNYPAWSISMEWLAYLVFPPLIRTLVRYRGPAAIPGLGIAVLGLGAPFLTTSAGGHLVRIGAEFTAGCLMFLPSR